MTSSSGCVSADTTSGRWTCISTGWSGRSLSWRARHRTARPTRDRTRGLRVYPRTGSARPTMGHRSGWGRRLCIGANRPTQALRSTWVRPTIQARRNVWAHRIGWGRRSTCVPSRWVLPSQAVRRSGWDPRSEQVIRRSGWGRRNSVCLPLPGAAAQPGRTPRRPTRRARAPRHRVTGHRVPVGRPGGPSRAGAAVTRSRTRTRVTTSPGTAVTSPTSPVGTRHPVPRWKT